jgi:hypothetical protein
MLDKAAGSRVVGGVVDPAAALRGIRQYRQVDREAYGVGRHILLARQRRMVAVIEEFRQVVEALTASGAESRGVGLGVARVAD